jgi:hypothetical protein
MLEQLESVMLRHKILEIVSAIVTDMPNVMWKLGKLYLEKHPKVGKSHLL